jgi:predicted nucleotidyltransferase
MRTKSPINALMPEKRAQILSVLFMHPEKSWYLHELADSLKANPSSLHRELQVLSDAGILSRETSGNRVYFTASQDCPFYHELRGLLTKTTGVIDVLRAALKPLKKKIKLAFVFGSVASGTETSESDIDVLIVGDVKLAEIVPTLSSIEEQTGREVNPIIYTESGLQAKLKKDNSFLNQVSSGAILYIYGDDSVKAKYFGEE